MHKTVYRNKTRNAVLFHNRHRAFVKQTHSVILKTGFKGILKSGISFPILYLCLHIGYGSSFKLSSFRSFITRTAQVAEVCVALHLTPTSFWRLSTFLHTRFVCIILWFQASCQRSYTSFPLRIGLAKSQPHMLLSVVHHVRHLWIRNADYILSRLFNGAR